MNDKTAVKPSETAGTVEFHKGLEGIVAALSGITYLDGLKGQMLYRGYSAIDLAGNIGYEEVLYLLWHSELPTRAQLDSFTSLFVPNRILPPEADQLMRSLPSKTHPMDVLRTVVSFLGAHDPEGVLYSDEVNRRKAIRLVARLATITAAWERIRNGLDPVRPDPKLGHTANFLYMLKGEKPDALSVQALDMYLTLLADHDLNASTFAARVVTSTLSDVHSAITAAIGALKGPLHGGANEQAMLMFQDINDVQRVPAYIEKAIADKKKIMGFGHRVYKVEDPRSAPLREMARKLGEARKDLRWYNIAVKVAEEVHKRKNINTNVDFYSAPVLYMLGIQPDLFTPIFAVARIAGWTAHIFEQMADNRIIRPSSEYVGPPARAFVPLDQRR
jgi:citrate synthase